MMMMMMMTVVLDLYGGFASRYGSGIGRISRTVRNCAVFDTSSLNKFTSSFIVDLSPYDLFLWRYVYYYASS